MPAPGTVWAADTWDVDAWAADTWAAAQVSVGYGGWGFGYKSFVLRIAGYFSRRRRG